MNLQSILRDILEIADHYADVYDGQPNDWMRVKMLAESGIEKDPDFPHPLNGSGAFMGIWSTWLQYRRERKLPAYKPTGLKAQLNRLAKMGSDSAIKAIEYSICQGYQGIYEERQGSAAKNTRSTGTLNGTGRYNLGAGVHGGQRPKASEGV